MTTTRKRWPLIVIGAAAGTSTWSGWVGLGSLAGFGVVKPFPGIADGVALNTAITLPIGVEAYAIYALYVATTSGHLTGRARRFAWGSSGAALALGMFGQAAYHLMAAQGVAAAPPWVVVAVSCLPVLVLGAASLLWHLAGETTGAVSVIAPITDIPPVPVSVDERPAPAPVAAPLPEPVPVEPPPAPRPRPVARPVTVPEVELDRIIRATLAHDAAAGYTTVTTAIKDAGYAVGNTGRVKRAISAAKNPTLRVVAGGQ